MENLTTKHSLRIGLSLFIVLILFPCQTLYAIPGDLDEDLKVDFIDFAILGQGWQTTYDMNTLADIADN
jgi:hypothetical protein